MQQASYSSMNARLDAFVGNDMKVLMNRPDITELYINDDGYVWYESYLDGKVKTSVKFEPSKAKAFIEMIAGDSGKVVNDDVCSLSTEIVGYGYRFQGELPPLVRNPQFNIRKKATKIFTFADYVESGTMSQNYRDYLEDAIRVRKNILVVGGTGTGKTTFLNAVLEAISRISPQHRIISLEDLPELQCPSDDYSPMFTKQDTGKSGVKFDMTRLLMDCMRRSPDRIIVGEVRDGCSYTMLKAWNTGHPGGACTVHADTAESGLLRIESLALEAPDAPRNITVLRKLIGQAIDVVVSIEHVRFADGTKGRRIKDVVEVKSYNDSTNSYEMRKVFGKVNDMAENSSAVNQKVDEIIK